MNQQQLLQVALACLKAIDDDASGALSPLEISRRQGLPMKDCLAVVHKLSRAGFISLPEDGRAALRCDLSAITALELLSAVWAPEPEAPDFQMLYGGSHGQRYATTTTYLQRMAGDDEEVLNG